MALDTRGAMHGFAQGFGMMDQHYNNQHRQQMDREMLGLRQEEAEWNREARGRQKQQWQQEDTDRDLTNLFQKAQTHGWESLNEHDRSTAQRIYQQNPQALPPELQQWVRTSEARSQHLGSAAEEAIGLPKQVAQAQAQQTHQYKQAVERASKLNPDNGGFILEKLLTGSGELEPEEAEALDEAPAGLMMMGTPEMDAALQSVDEQMAIISSGENIHVTPQFLESVNMIYDNQIGEGKRIVGIYPGKRSGTVVFELEVDGEDGSYRAPMTANRGTEADDDNEIKQIPIEELIDSLQGAKALHMAFKADPEAQQRLQRFGQMRGYLPQAEEQWITQQDQYGRVTRINAKTGRAESVHGHLPADHLGRGSHDADIQKRIEHTMNNLQRIEMQEDDFGTMNPEAREASKNQLLSASALELYGPIGTPDMLLELIADTRAEGRRPTYADIQAQIQGKMLAMRQMEQQQAQRAQQPGLQAPGAQPPPRGGNGRAYPASPMMNRLDEKSAMSGY